MNIHAHEATHAVAADHVPRTGEDHVVSDAMHPLRTMGPKYPPHDSSAPVFEGIDLAGLAAAIVITLGPLAAYSLGMGA